MDRMSRNQRVLGGPCQPSRLHTFNSLEFLKFSSALRRLQGTALANCV